MELSDLTCTFVTTEKIKQSGVGTHLKPVKFLEYRKDQKLWVIKHLSKPKFFETVVNYFLAM